MHVVNVCYDKNILGVKCIEKLTEKIYVEVFPY